MRYQIFYQNGGDINITNLLNKLDVHKETFDSLFGPDNWVFTGSAAVIIYALKYAPELINTLDEPNDLDFLVKSKSQLTLTYIGNLYDKRKQDSLERSYTFYNSINGQSIDVSTVPSLKIINVDDYPLCDISLLLEEYNDPLSGNRDKDIKKINALEIIAPLVFRPEVKDTTDYSHLDGIRKGPLF